MSEGVKKAWKEGRLTAPVPKGTRQVPYETIVCEQCGKTFEMAPGKYNCLRKRKGARFCSTKCAGLFNVKAGKEHRQWTRLSRICKQCGTEFWAQPNLIATGGGKFCSKACQYKYWREQGTFYGENSPMWNGGTSFFPYDLAFTDSLKREIRERDDNQCQICGAFEEELGLPLAVHHIDYDKQNSWAGNLIALCFPCHSRTNQNRAMWTDYFYIQNNIVAA